MLWSRIWSNGRGASCGPAKITMGMSNLTPSRKALDLLASWQASWSALMAVLKQRPRTERWRAIIGSTKKARLRQLIVLPVFTLGPEGSGIGAGSTETAPSRNGPWSSKRPSLALSKTRAWWQKIWRFLSPATESQPERPGEARRNFWKMLIRPLRRWWASDELSNMLFLAKKVYCVSICIFLLLMENLFIFRFFDFIFFWFFDFSIFWFLVFSFSYFSILSFLRFHFLIFQFFNFFIFWFFDFSIFNFLIFYFFDFSIFWFFDFRFFDFLIFDFSIFLIFRFFDFFNYFLLFQFFNFFHFF